MMLKRPLSRARWFLTLLNLKWREIFILYRPTDCWALLLAQIYMVKFILFNFISVFDDLEAFLSQQTQRTGDKAHLVVDIETTFGLFTLR